VGPERVAALTKFSADPEASTVASQVKDIKKIRGGIEEFRPAGRTCSWAENSVIRKRFVFLTGSGSRS